MGSSKSNLEQVKNILLEHTGPSEAISSGDIAEELDIEESDTRSRTRELIWKAMRIYELPIGANTKGYFLIKSDSVFQDCIDLLEKRQEGIEERKDLLKKVYEGGES